MMKTNLLSGVTIIVVLLIPEFYLDYLLASETTQ